MKRSWRLLLLLPILWLGLVAMNFLSSPATKLGLTEGRLPACPGSPNCVSSQSHDPDHAIDPIACQGNWPEVSAKIKQTLERMPGMRVVEDKEHYLHATATSLLLRFVDDVEFTYDEPRGLLHFRSASRIGYSDLGVNRRRMELFRSLFENAQASR